MQDSADQHLSPEAKNRMSGLLSGGMQRAATTVIKPNEIKAAFGINGL